MSFTDDNGPTDPKFVFDDFALKRLKEFAECGDPTSHRVLSSEEMAALLVRLESAETERDALRRAREHTKVRLEAAEACIEEFKLPETVGVVQRWRKAKGDLSESEEAAGK